MSTEILKDNEQLGDGKLSGEERKFLEKNSNFFSPVFDKMETKLRKILEDRESDFKSRISDMKDIVYYVLNVSEISSPKDIYDAVKKFQKENNLQGDGIIGSKTKRMMQKAFQVKKSLVEKSSTGQETRNTSKPKPQTILNTEPNKEPGLNFNLGKEATDEQALERAKRISNYLSNKSYTISTPDGGSLNYTIPKHVAAAIAGNAFQESRCKCNAVNKRSGAFGIFQWLGTRKTDYLNYAKSNDKPTNDIQTQLDFIFNESTISHHRGTDSYHTMIALQNTTTVEEATKVFRKVYERCGWREKNDKKRISIAKAIFDS